MSLGIGIVNPRKRREIEGVGTGSMIDLKATLFKAQEDAKHGKTNSGSTGVGKLTVKEPSKNKGVDSRSRRDEEELQKVLDPSAVLEQKMEKYRSMVREGFRDEKEQFLVDFEQKKWDGAGADEPHAAGLDTLLATPATLAGGTSEATEEARLLEESVRRDLAETDAKSGADALLAKRREAARRRMQAAAAAGQSRTTAPPAPK